MRSIDSGPKLAVTALAALALPCAAAGSEDDVALAVARDAVEQGVYLFGLSGLERLSSDEGFQHRDEATILLARARFGLGEAEEAARLLEGYEVSFPASTRFFLEAAYWRAMADLRIAGRADRGSAERGELLRSAREGFQWVIDESVDPALLAGARFELGVALYMAGDFEEALEAFRRARQLGVASEDRHELGMYVGRCNLSLRNFADAARDFAELVASAPTSASTGPGPLLPEAYYGLGEARYYLEEWEKAAQAYEAAGRAGAAAGGGTLGALARCAFGWASLKLGDERHARGDLAGAQESRLRAFESFDSLVNDPTASVSTRDSAAFEAGEMLFRLARYAGAAERLLPLTDLTRYPKHAPSALYLLGRCRTALGQLAEGIDSFERVLEIGGGVSPELDRRTRYALADALVELGGPVQARERLAPLAARERLPSIRADALFKTARISRRAAAVAMREGRKDEAAKHYADAYERLLSIKSDRAASAELSAGEVAYWLGRSAHDRSELAPEASASRGEWERRALAAFDLTAYDPTGARAVHGEWRERALGDKGALEHGRKKFDAAAEAFGELLDVPGLSAEREIAARMGLAEVELDRGRPDTALEMLAPLLARADLAAGREKARHETAVALYRKGELEEAVKTFEIFLEKYPASELLPAAREGLGRAFRELGRFAEAAAEYEKVLADFPGYDFSDRTRLAAGDARRDASEVEMALAHYRVLFERGKLPRLRARARLNEAKLAHAAGAGEEALELLGQAEGAAPGEEIAHDIAECRGVVLVSLGRFEEAARSFAYAAGSERETLRLRARYEESRALFALGTSAEAAGAADVIRRSARGLSWVVYNSRGEGELSELSELRESAIFEAAEALVALASVEEAAGRADAARKELTEAKGLLALSADRAKAAARTREIEAKLMSRRSATREAEPITE